MPPDPWAAIDTPPLSMVRAKPLRDPWEQFLGEGRLGEPAARWQAHPLAAAAGLIRDCLGPIAAETGQLIVVSDASGMLLWIDGPPGDAGDAAESTNFSEVVQERTCSAAPVHDPDTGQILGVIDLTGKLGAVQPYSFGCVVATARAVESHLRYLIGERDAWLPTRYEDPIDATARRPLLRLTLLRRGEPRVELDGRPLRLSPIRTEILALLSARREGMTSEELAADLYGDVGRPSAVRVQVFRLRKLLGQWIDAAPYRLSIDVESDVAEVCALLARGAVREAAERYEAPLLAHSEAPGVIRERDALEAWLRHAVMTTADAEALWAWTQSSSGCDDLAAWKRLLANLDYCDPRRSLAASRVGSLRAAYGVEGTSSARR